MIIHLRSITEEDTEKIVNWRNQPWVLQYFIDQRLLTKESHENYYHSRIETGLVKQWIIVSDGKDIGTCFLRDIDRIKKIAEYGVFIGEKDYIAKGIGKRCLKEVCRIAFNEEGLETIFARVQKNNLRSVNSFLSCGFALCEKTETVRIHNEDVEIVFLEKVKEESNKEEETL